MHKRHFWIMIACVISLLLIFLLPVFKVNGGFRIMMIIIFILNLLMVTYNLRLLHQGNKNQNDKEEHHEDY